MDQRELGQRGKDPNRQRRHDQQTGVFQDQTIAAVAIANDFGGATSTFNNTGTF